MAKGRIKKYDGVRAEAVKWVAREFEVTVVYVRMAISGTATNGRSDEIRKAYKEKYAELQRVLS